MPTTRTPKKAQDATPAPLFLPPADEPAPALPAEQPSGPKRPFEPFHASEPAPVLTDADIPPVSDLPPGVIYPVLLWTITPQMAICLMKRHNAVEQAHELLGWKRTGRNRNVRWNDVDKYGRDMAAENWQGRNGETIKVAHDGSVGDGQHRLDACIRSGTAFESYVVFGVLPEWQDTIDRNIARKIHDTLHLRGEAYANNLATIARWSWRWVRGARTRSGHGFPVPSDQELLEWIEQDERIKIATDWAVKAYASCARIIRVGVLGMAWLICHGENFVAAEVFLRQVATGENLREGDPALALRNQLMTIKQTKKLQNPNEHQELYLLLKTWQAFLREDQIFGNVGWPSGGMAEVNQKSFSKLVDGAR